MTPGNDTILASGEDETLAGAAGADVFVLAAAGGGTTTILDFVPGTDRLDLSLLGITRFETLATLLRQDEDGNAVLPALVNNASPSVVLAGVAPDALDAGDVILATGTADDAIAAETPGAVLVGGGGDDTLVADGFGVFGFGEDGDDLLLGGEAPGDTLSGGDGNDTVDGRGGQEGTGGDQLFGDAGDDELRGSFAQFGGEGRDRHILSFLTVAEGGGGEDTFVVTSDTVGAFVRDFTLGEDVLDVTATRLSDRASLQRILAEDGAGGTRFPLVFVDGPQPLLSVAGIAPAALAASPAVRLSTVSADDAVVFDNSGFGAGGLGDDDLSNGGFVDLILFGEGGDDTLTAGSGGDTLVGGAGDDSLQGAFVVGGAVLEGGLGDDTLVGGSTQEGGAGADSLDAADGAATSQFGGAGNDTLVGGRLAEGGAGDDSLLGFNVSDLTFAAVFSGGDGNDTIVALEPGEFGDAVGADTIGGGSGNDSLDGGAEGDRLNGGSGDDTVAGGTGDDFIDATTGADSIIGGAGADTAWGGKGDDALDGGDGADSLIGSPGDDTLLGGDGNDTLKGGWDDDRLDGGADADVFLYLAGDTGADTIADLDAEDLVRLSAADAAGGIAALLAAAIDGPAGATIDFGGGRSLVFAGLTADDLAARAAQFELV